MRGGAGACDGGVEDDGVDVSDFILFAHHDALLIRSHRANLYSMMPRSSN